MELNGEIKMFYFLKLDIEKFFPNGSFEKLSKKKQHEFRKKYNEIQRNFDERISRNEKGGRH